MWNCNEKTEEKAYADTAKHKSTTHFQFCQAISTDFIVLFQFFSSHVDRIGKESVLVDSHALAWAYNKTSSTTLHVTYPGFPRLFRTKPGSRLLICPRYRDGASVEWIQQSQQPRPTPAATHISCAMSRLHYGHKPAAYRIPNSLSLEQILTRDMNWHGYELAYKSAA